MSDLTTDQLADFRADIADDGDPPAFDDDELNRLYTRADDNYNRAVLRAIDQLIASAAKFTQYTQNESQERKDQIFDHLLKLRTVWQQRVDSEEDAPANIRVVKVKPTTVHKHYPKDGTNYRRHRSHRHARHWELVDDDDHW